MDEINRVMRTSQEALSKFSDSFDDVMITIEQLQTNCSEYESEIGFLGNELDFTYEELSLCRKELYYLGRIISDNDIEIPLGGHVIDFGTFLPADDPRRHSFETE